MANISVSKGVFAHVGCYKIGQNKKAPRRYEYFTEPWYVAYKETWNAIQLEVESARLKMTHQVTSDLMAFVSSVKNNTIDIFADEIPTAILLTGVNVPDHAKLFQKIVRKLESLTPHVATLWSKESNSKKSIVCDTVYQLLNNLEEDDTEIKRSQCTMRALKLWYLTHCEPSDPIIIIISDFESFSPSVLHDFILILSSYSDTIKFILLFGIATTLHIVHKSLSYDATSKLKIKVLHMQTQVKSLADLLEVTILSPDILFKLTGRAFQLLTDIFLFYDFSVDRFLQNYKLCMIQHFYGNNVNSLCCYPRNIKRRLSALSEEDIGDLKKLPSVVKYLQTQQLDVNKISDEAFKDTIKELLNQFHKYMSRFLTVLRCLHSLVSTLPNAQLGKQLREVYTKAVYYSSNLTESQEYKECLQLLNFLSKEEFLQKLESIVTIIENTKDDPLMGEFKANLTTRMNAIRDASLDVESGPAQIVTVNEKLTRLQLKEKLLKMSQTHKRSPYKEAQLDLMNYLDREIFRVYLVNPNQVPMNEIFCYSDGNSVKQHIRGSVRGAIHTGLNDPQVYLQCDCCKLENEDAMPATLPDLSIIYKLHLESRKLINMYDWLQAFATIVDPAEDNDEERRIDPTIQARFTRAVAELQFLGFIKATNQKADHVKKLT